MRLGSIFTVCLLFGHLAHADVGFLSPNDPSLPAPVRAVAPSIDRIILAAGVIDHSCPAKVACPPVNGKASGSAYPFGAPHQVSTNLHNILAATSDKFYENRDFEEQERIDAMKGLKLYAKLLSPKGQRIFEGTARLGYFPQVAPMLSGIFEGSGSFHLADYVELEIPASLAKPLKPASREPVTGDTIYVIGYPRKTTGHATHDSDGVSEFVTRGKVLSYEDYSTMTGQTYEEPYLSLFKENIITAAIDCEHGNSGGPAVNAQGEVVGTLMAIANEDIPLDHRACLILKSNSKADLQKLWPLLQHVTF